MNCGLMSSVAEALMLETFTSLGGAGGAEVMPVETFGLFAGKTISDFSRSVSPFAATTTIIRQKTTHRHILKVEV